MLRRKSHSTSSVSRRLKIYNASFHLCALALTAANGPLISIRGIQGNNAATTGVYLDESPLQARTLGGLVTGGGTFLPLLFDLERIEVLKGPQGTLYGSSSEGGTIRYITPEPGLTEYTSYARAEFNSIKDGDVGGELGVAVGGPIIEDKLGFRVSVWGRRIGGWVDHVDWRNGQTPCRQTPTRRIRRPFKGALRWQRTEQLEITPSFYYAWDRKNDLDTIYNDVPQYTTPAIGTVLTGAGAQTAADLADRHAGPACRSPSAACCRRGYTPSSADRVPGDAASSSATRTYRAISARRCSSIPRTRYGPINLGPLHVAVQHRRRRRLHRRDRAGAAPRTVAHLAGQPRPATSTPASVQIKSITSWLRDAGAG